MRATDIQILFSTIHIKRVLSYWASAFIRDIMQENENVSWHACPKISNSKWQHPCWLACFSIKLGYTSDEERWPTSILMTCFTCVWANECVCVRGRNGWREEVRKARRERENVLVSSSSWPLLFPKGSFGLQTLHCIIAGTREDPWIVASGSVVLAGNRLTRDRTTIILGRWEIQS